MSYRVFIFDIDNTLTSSRDWNFVPSAMEALKQLRKKGHTVVISSGRTPKAAVMLEKNGIEYDYFVGANGHLVADGQGNILWSVRFDRELCDRIDEFCIRNDMGYFWKLEDCSYITVNHENIDKIFELYKSKTVTERPDDFSPFGGALVTSAEKARQFEKEFSEDTDCVDGGALIYDILLKGVSKKDGIRELLKILNASREECMAFGDSLNDLEMLEYAGMGVAMADGQKEALEKADYITAETYNDGIKKALEYFGVL